LTIRGRGRLAVVFATACFTLASPARVRSGQETKQDLTLQPSGVRDFASLFSLEATKKATAELERLERTYRVETVIETVGTLNDVSIEAAVAKNAQRSRLNGIYILIDKQSHSLRVAETGSFGGLPKSDNEEIRTAFVNGFRQREFDKGLADGVRSIEKVLASAKGAVKPEPRAESPADGLIVRNQLRLTLAGARTIVAGAEAKAAAMGLKVNIAVVDDGGHILSFDRMDGARPASGYTAITKATTAATFRAETGPLPKGAPAPDLLMSLSVQLAAGASGGKVTTLVGGVPVMVDGQVIGGVGVGGAQTGEQDAEVAKAGIAGLLEALKPSTTLDRAKDAFIRPESK
jgi:glc operon protein GlcG